ncbi:CU044_5270 family protein [Streptomyces sp. SID12488]|uniref:CU044_5270 family protein n=1 Tax=Streptomyces sp. SID12488 TaxID=2706040 RepID=UPI0013DA209D|nr:CU044_5270 family protein [Streptomyces sp. SID12488]NEA64412.1 Tat pathway signal protein [Streptomyces sp. SID12488]
MNELKLLREWDADAPALTDAARTRARFRLHQAMREPAAPMTIGRRPLLRVAVAAVAAGTVTATVVVAQNTGTSPHTQPVSAATVLRGAASEERKLEKPIAPRDDQFIYSKEITKETPVGGGRTKTYVDESWSSVDGSKKSYGGELGNAQWFPPFKPGERLWPPNRWSELKQLPTDPVKLPIALLGLLGKPDPDGPFKWLMVQTGLSYLLRKAVLPKGLRPAAFEALATVPGIKLLPGLTDAAGRPGVGIQYVDPNMPRGGVEQVLVFDAKTYQYLGTRGQRKEGGTTYQQWSYHAVGGVVDRVMQRP